MATLMATYFTVCSSDLKNFENSQPSASNFKSFSRSLKQYFLIVKPILVTKYQLMTFFLKNAFCNLTRKVITETSCTF